MNLTKIKSRHLTVFLSLVLILCVVLGVLHLKTDKNPPDIRLDAEETLGRHSLILVNIYGGQNIDTAEVQIEAVQNGARERLAPFARHQDQGGVPLRLELNLAQSALLQDGELQIEIKARSKQNSNKFGGIFAPFWTVKSFIVKADLSPPQAVFTCSPKVISQGGAALLALEASEELERISLERDEQAATVWPLSARRFVALAAFPQGSPLESYALELRLADRAGNIATSIIGLDAEGFDFRDDPISLNDAFFQKKHKEFSEYSGKDLPPLELFLHMNRDVRSHSYKRLRLLCRGGTREKLWDGAFLEMPSATRRSEFADRRDYIYKGEQIDRQVHLGLDYASIAKDRIPAANNGRVSFVGYLGIHGNAVLMDHGLGLFSLYSHLSSIEAREGQSLAKGDIIGRTGASGMAGGDHLHFEILVNGVSVNPDFWFDAEWVEQNIDAPLARFKEEAHE